MSDPGDIRGVGAGPLGRDQLMEVTFVAGMIECPNASPQPTSPSSVAVRTNRTSKTVQRGPGSSSGGAPTSEGSRTTIVSTVEIFTATQPLAARLLPA